MAISPRRYGRRALAQDAFRLFLEGDRGNKHRNRTYPYKSKSYSPIWES